MTFEAVIEMCRKLLADAYTNRRRYMRWTRIRTSSSSRRKKFGIPANAEITVQIPSGRDWSGESAVIDDNEAIPHIKVDWEEVK